MRTKLMITIGLLLMAIPALAGDDTMATPSGWFDFENCVFCKNLLEDPELLPHTIWENHKIDNGMINVMAVEPEYQASMDKASKAMEQTGQDMESGKINPMQAEMCGHCQKWGVLMMGGVKIEQVKTSIGEITITTSENPDLVKQMHELVERNDKEMALMMGDGHDHGHDHHH